MTLLLKNLLFTFLVPGTVAGWVPWWIVGERAVPGGPTRVVAGLLFALGGAIYAWCVWDFARFGRGTPAPIDAPRRLVVRGLYRFTRNPMYVGVLTVIFAWATLYRAPELFVYGLCVWGVFHAFIVFYEEPQLAEAFAVEYAPYRSRVSRWLPLRRGGSREDG